MTDVHGVVRAREQPTTGEMWWWIVDGAGVGVAFIATGIPNAENRREYSIDAECIDIHYDNNGTFEAKEVTEMDVMKIWSRQPKRPFWWNFAGPA